MRYLIVGGTGTLGRALTKELMAEAGDDPCGGSYIPSVTCFSRDELKQQQLKRDFPLVKCMLGDIRDKSALMTAMLGADVVFHVAALKHVDVLENNPLEAVKTNVMGSANVADAAIAARVKYVAFSSTDKAVQPINIYGMSKAIAERHYLNLNNLQKTTQFSVFKWGNVCGSRGSVIPYFVKTLKEERAIYLTHPDMTRFWIKIEDAARFMMQNYHKTGSILIPEMKAAPIVQVVRTIADILSITDYRTVITSVRPGEKIHETIAPELSSNTAAQFTDGELRSLLAPIVEESA